MFMSTTAPSTATSSASAASSEVSSPSSTRSKRSMASATASAKNEARDTALTWSGKWTLTHRILAVNVLTLLLFTLSVFYLDAFRNRLRTEREQQISRQADIVADSLDRLQGPPRVSFLAEVGQDSDSRIRYYGPDGAKRNDSWE